jgi:hypothetical protein
MGHALLSNRAVLFDFNEPLVDMRQQPGIVS